MALPAERLSVVEVTKPNLGERVPAEVRAEITVDLSQFGPRGGAAREEWESFREHDVIFLVAIDATAAAKGSQSDDAAQALAATGPTGRKGGRQKRDMSVGEEDCSFPARYGVQHVRGAEVLELVDEAGQVLNDPMRPLDKGNTAQGTRRTFRVRLDPAQYHEDMRRGADVHETTNLVVRRKAKENNFKAVLETIRDLMNVSAVGKAVPPWLHDVFLGYGDPSAAHYRQLPTRLRELDFRDTFLDADHVHEAFPGKNVSFDGAARAPPYSLSFEEDGEASGSERVVVKPYTPPNPGPYPQDQPQRNSVRFTPAQVEAIRDGMNPGLTMVVGPPGTGKTDVAVQIIANIYRNFPQQRTLLVTHSNAALNDLFEKIMERDIEPRHLLRLGAGVKELRGADTTVDGDFSKFGRVNATLARRLELLDEVQRLAATLGVDQDVGYTCETAEFFSLYHIEARIEAYRAALASRAGDASSVAELFPFKAFFANAPAGSSLFKGENFSQDCEVAEGCLRHISHLFEELRSYRAFELLRTHRQRADYLLTKQARIIAMTCTHAALTRRHLVALGFKYDNVVMEEAAQILEVEAFIPMLLQASDAVDGCRLKRVVLIGDHNQLPPVVQNMAFQKYSKLDQSLFARFIRLGTPCVQLDRQGRARPSIAALYNWRYSGLGDLPAVQGVTHSSLYARANGGFGREFQFVDVGDLEGRGEPSPTPYFYQNLAEAEFVVATYMYMRLVGYPAERITLLTTYNGQKHLLRDILARRCDNAAFGLPSRVTTVDKFQGQQNDFVLLSLVRTRAVGHLRDVRRLVVATSRARLGLYIFGRRELFENCFELSPTFSVLLRHPASLELILGERYLTERAAGAPPPDPSARHVVSDCTSMGVLVQQVCHNPSSQLAPAHVPMCAAAGLDSPAPLRTCHSVLLAMTTACA